MKKEGVSHWLLVEQTVSLPVTVPLLEKEMLEVAEMVGVVDCKLVPVLEPHPVPEPRPLGTGLTLELTVPDVE